MKLKLDLHEIFNRGHDIDRALKGIIDQAVAQKAPRIGVIGLGRLGSREIDYDSDLDLIFLYDAAGGDSKVDTRAVTVAIAASPVANARIEPRVREIDEQVQRHQRRRHQHDVGLHDRVVAEQDRLDGESSHPG